MNLPDNTAEINVVLCLLLIPDAIVITHAGKNGHA